MVLTVLHKLNSKGKPYRKTLQYGYDSQQGIDRWMGMKLNGLDPWQHTVEYTQETFDDMYTCALLSPNYPAPTIRD